MRKKQQPEQRITALYARLSRDDEKEGISGNIQNQRTILEKFAKDNHLPNIRFFFDDGYSGVTFTRPAFMEIMDLAEQGLVANLVVKDHSRLGRNRLVVGQLLEEDFVRLNVRYIAIMDNIDTANGVSDIVRYEDMAKGLLSEERFATLSMAYETEQRELKAQIPELETMLDSASDKADDLQKFIDRAKRITRLTELTPEIVHEFIEKIVVSKPEKVDGKRRQRVDIYYNTIGLWCAPEPEEMERLFQEYLAEKQKKTA